MDAVTPLAGPDDFVTDRAAAGQTSSEQVPIDEFFREHSQFVWRGLRCLGVPLADVDDLLQEVFLVVHRRLGDFRADGDARGWLFGIVRMVVNNYRRSQRRSRGRAQAWARQADILAPAPSTPAESIEEREAAELVCEVLGRLEEKRREVMFLVELEEMPVTEVAAALGIPLNTAYSRLRLARADFKATLERTWRP